jgi:hypothetical protein
MSDAIKDRELDLLAELPDLAPPDDLVADVECLAFQELEASLGRWSVKKSGKPHTIVIVPRYESAVHAVLVAAYTVSAAQAALRVLQRFIAG